MASKTPAVGDAAIIQGERYTLVSFREAGDRKAARLESVAPRNVGTEDEPVEVPASTAGCDAADLVWIEQLDAWSLPGRLLSADVKSPLQKKVRRVLTMDEQVAVYARLHESD